MWIVKLGGSLSRAGTLAQWLAEIAAVGRGKIIVVPGGGSYAGAVRTEQERWHFDDSRAHSMALLAMDQYGMQLESIGNARTPEVFLLARDDQALRDALRANRIPVWLPSQWADSDRALPRYWGVTSDSLALWLACRLGITQVILVKSAQVVAGAAEPEDLVRCGLVDEEFPRMLQPVQYGVRLLGANHIERFSDVILRKAPVGLKVTGSCFR